MRHFIDFTFNSIIDGQIIVQRPSVWAINLNTDLIIGRFEISADIVPNGQGLSGITIDDDNCAHSFVYISDWLNNALIVFSVAENRAWRFNHNFFFFNPFEGDFNVDGEEILQSKIKYCFDNFLCRFAIPMERRNFLSRTFRSEEKRIPHSFFPSIVVPK